MVWLTREFRDEHRQALDWLNQRTGEDTQFFGVVVELWKIDESKPAPHFNLVATPNDWRKGSVSRVSGQNEGPVSERQDRYRTFFQELIDTLREEHRFTGMKKAQPQNWHTFSSGRGKLFVYGANFTRDNQARVEVYIDGGDADQNNEMLESLSSSREEIEASLCGDPLDWQRLETRRACRIATTRPGSIDNDSDTLSEIHDWMVDKLLRFKEAFDPHLRELV